jgi:hypothetical protein
MQYGKLYTLNLKEVWNQFPFLNRNISYFSEQYNRFGFRFIPLNITS